MVITWEHTDDDFTFEELTRTINWIINVEANRYLLEPHDLETEEGAHQ